LIPDSERAAYAKKNLHLMVVTDLEAGSGEFVDPVKAAVYEVQDYLYDHIEGKSKDTIEEVKKLLEAQKEELLKCIKEGKGGDDKDKDSDKDD
jgi:hypothetical protein